MNRTRALVAALAALMVVAVVSPDVALAQKTVLRLRVTGPMMEAPSDAAGLWAMLGNEKFQTLRQWVDDVRSAAQDSKIDGLVLIVEQPQVSLSQIEEMTAAIDYFKSKGKPVYCYLDSGSNATYALAACADHISLAENGELDIIGLNAEAMYFKGLLDKIGVQMQGITCGAYKSALEPFMRSEPSPAAAENLNWLMDGIYQSWLEMMAKGRGLKVDDVKKLVNQAPLSAEEAQKAGLVDEVQPFYEFAQEIKKKFGSDVNVLTEYNEQLGPKIDLNNPFALFDLLSKIMQGVSPVTQEGIGLIYIDGAIVVGKSDDDPLTGTSAGSTTIRGAIDQARRDDNIKAVVLRVDSPGGSALASDIIWEAATRCAKEKPLIVSMGQVAGSGGYYVSLPGDTIFADPTTITASIGVLAGKPVWKDLMENHLGINIVPFTRGENAALMSPSQPWDEREQKEIRDLIDRVYKQFKDRVMTSRGSKIKGNLDDLAAGRVFTGKQALEHGLIDKLGGLEDAIALAKSRADLPADAHVQVFPKPSDLVALLNLFEQFGKKPGEDDWHIRTMLNQGGLLSTALPMLQRFSPEVAAEVQRLLRNVIILQRERVGCFMPTVPIVH